MLYANYLRNKYHNLAHFGTAEGSPCIFKTNKAADLMDYRIYGNSQGVGDKSTNMLDSAVFERGGITSAGGGLFGSMSRIRTDLIEVQGDTAYSFFVDVSYISSWVAIVQYDEDLSLVKHAGTVNGTTFTTESSTKYIRLVLQKPIASENFTNDEVSEIQSSHSQLVKGTQLGTYIPFGKYGITVNCSGRNLCDEQWELGGIGAETGQNTPSNALLRTKNYIPLTAGETYFFNLESNVYFYDKDKNYITYAWFAHNTALIPEGYAYARVRLPAAYGNEYKNDVCINISDASFNGQYEPYIEPFKTTVCVDEPLYQFGEYADYIDFKNKKVIRYTDGICSEESIDLPVIKAHKGTNIVIVNSSVPASNIYVKYIK